MNVVTTAVLGAALFVYILYWQCARRPVTRRDLLLPAIGALYLGSRYLNDANVHNAAIVLTAALIGVGTGLLAGQVIRVYKDDVTGMVHQFGGWPYAVAFLSLLLLRVAMRVVVNRTGILASATVLNDAFIGMMVGNFLGRAVNVGARALALLDWDYTALPHGRRVRRARRHS